MRDGAGGRPGRPDDDEAVPTEIPPLPLIARAPGPGGFRSSADVPEEPLADPGAVRNTLLRLGSQFAGLVFTGGLTLYLVRALGASGYGVYALAGSIGSLVLYPAGLGLPWAVGRFLADYREDLVQLRAILRLGLKLQIVSATVAGAILFSASGPLADAFGRPHLGWPLRWVALSILGQALFSFLVSAVTSVRRVAISLWMAIIESVSEASLSAGLVLAGAGAAGATLGKAIGYTVAAVAGTYLTVRLLGGAGRRAAASVHVGTRAIVRYAGAMLVVDVAWSAVSQIDVLLIGALLTSAAVGSFGAVVKILTVLATLGIAVSSGVAPRLSLRGGGTDEQAFAQAIRYLIIIQGLVIAPMTIWSRPIVELLLGPGYHSSPAILRVLTVQAFVSAPASLISVGVTYLGEARRRVRIVLASLVLGLVSTYILIRVMGVVGAAIGDDLVQVAYVAANLWICSRLITLDLMAITRSMMRTLLAAAAMAVVLLVLGTDHLSPAAWIAGLVAGGVVYAAVLLGTRELTVAELRMLAARLPVPSRGGSG
jgi:O-antigen/teichoic acid export membrane protein